MTPFEEEGHALPPNVSNTDILRQASSFAISIIADFECPSSSSSDTAIGLRSSFASQGEEGREKKDSEVHENVGMEDEEKVDEEEEEVNPLKQPSGELNEIAATSETQSYGGLFDPETGEVYFDSQAAANFLSGLRHVKSDKKLRGREEKDGVSCVSGGVVEEEEDVRSLREGKLFSSTPPHNEDLLPPSRYALVGSIGWRHDKGIERTLVNQGLLGGRMLFTHQRALVGIASTLATQSDDGLRFGTSEFNISGPQTPKTLKNGSQDSVSQKKRTKPLSWRRLLEPDKQRRVAGLSTIAYRGVDFERYPLYDPDTRTIPLAGDRKVKASKWRRHRVPRARPRRWDNFTSTMQPSFAWTKYTWKRANSTRDSTAAVQHKGGGVFGVKLAPVVWGGDTGSLQQRKKRRKGRNQRGGRGRSYLELLVATEEEYDPYFLDNARFKQGKRHQLMGLPGYQLSVIPFVKPKKLKEELNSQFRATHPWIHPTITLSKLRNLKADMFAILDRMPSIDISTVAIGWVYFERLVLKRVVHKHTRKLLAGTCLVLAYKFNQAIRPIHLSELVVNVQKLDKTENLSRRLLFASEFPVYVLLSFSLQLSFRQVVPHILQYLESRDQSFEDVYGLSVDSFYDNHSAEASGVPRRSLPERGGCDEDEMSCLSAAV